MNNEKCSASVIYVKTIKNSFRTFEIKQKSNIIIRYKLQLEILPWQQTEINCI